MQWFFDNWIAVLASVVAVYGAVLSTILAVLQRRDRLDRIRIEHPFWIQGRAASAPDDPIVVPARDQMLRVKVINTGQRPVYVDTVEVMQKGETWESGSQLVDVSRTLQTVKPGVSSTPIDSGDHRFYEQSSSELSLFREFKDGWITVTTRRGKKFRKDIDYRRLRDEGVVSVD
ncbi:MAG: hypothetical protein ACYS0D_04275 [Planctomycetota bacterium]|jgi:hypothetical protein